METREQVRVVVLDDYQGVAASLANWDHEAIPMDVRFVQAHIDNEDALEEVLRDAQVVVVMRERTPLRASLLARLPSLRLIVTTGMRNDAIDSVDGITVCGTPILPTPVVELTWALILGLNRQLVSEASSTRRGDWQQTVGEGLAGTTIGLLGLGKVGVRMARIAQAFDMRVIAWSQNLTAEAAREHGVERVDESALFSEADILSVHLRLSERTRGLVDASRLQLMKASAILVNTARAEIVDQDALMEALTAGRIRGAGIDVFDTEPLPAGHPILSAPNTLLTPHIGYVVRQNYELFYPAAVEAIAGFIAGSPIRVISDSAK